MQAKSRPQPIVSIIFGVLTIFRLRCPLCYPNRFRNVFLLCTGLPDPCHVTDDIPHPVLDIGQLLFGYGLIKLPPPLAPLTHTHKLYIGRFCEIVGIVNLKMNLGKRRVPPIWRQFWRFEGSSICETVGLVNLKMIQGKRRLPPIWKRFWRIRE